MKKKISLVFLLALSASLIAGCLLTRLHQTQKQVCSRKARLEMTKEGLQIVFDQPLLSREDIIAILRAESSSGAEDGDVVYRLRNTVDDAYSFPVFFGFRRDGKEYKLTRVSLGKRLQDFLAEDLLHEIFDAGCSARRKGLGIEVDLSGVRRGKLPDFDRVKQLLGKPAAATESTAEYVYAINDKDALEISITFGGKMQKLMTAGVLFQRYSLVFDFHKGLAAGNLKNFSDALRLGLKP